MNMIDVRNHVTCMNCANRYTNVCSQCLNKDEFRAKDRFLDEYVRKDVEITKKVLDNFVASKPIDRIVKTCEVTTNYRLIPNVIKDVIFNPPATIILWEDGTKTVVKAQNGEPFDPEKGMAMAIVKKTFGNKGHYFDAIKEFTVPYYLKNKYPNAFRRFKNVDFEARIVVLNIDGVDEEFEVKCRNDEELEEMFRLYEPKAALDEPNEVKKVAERYMENSPRPEKPWKIWVRERDDNGNITAVTTTSHNYSSRSAAVRRARKLYGHLENHEYDAHTLLGGTVEWCVAQENPYGY